MREEFLHYIWRFGFFDQENLQTVDGQKVQVVKPGSLNTNAGPDFFNARIYLDDALWSGNIEIHVNESEWTRHGHQHDEAYNNVVLHVVLEGEGPTLNSRGKQIPVLKLNGRIPVRQNELYERFMASKQFIACQGMFSQVEKGIVNTWLERVLIERLEQKSTGIKLCLERNRGDWLQTFWEQLAKAFGFKTNAEPMEMLARSLPYMLIEKYRHSLVSIEALLFGQAGMLSDFLEDEYYRALQNEYAFLAKKHQLIAIPVSSWKFGRMRPANFPTVRIAQLASLIHNKGNLFNKLVGDENSGIDPAGFMCSPSEFWNRHYTFAKPSSKASSKELGADAAVSLLINVAVPFLFAYGRHIGNAVLAERSLQILEQLPAEKNSIISGFDKLGVKAADAAQSQSLLQLKSSFCDNKKCLNCGIGIQLIKQSGA